MAKLSKKGSINFFDLVKSFIVTIGTTLIGSLVPVISTGSLPTHPQMTLIFGTAAGAGITYLMKQFATDGNGQLKIGAESSK